MVLKGSDFLISPDCIHCMLMRRDANRKSRHRNKLSSKRQLKSKIRHPNLIKDRQPVRIPIQKSGHLEDTGRAEMGNAMRETLIRSELYACWTVALTVQQVLKQLLVVILKDSLRLFVVLPRDFSNCRALWARILAWWGSRFNV